MTARRAGGVPPGVKQVRLQLSERQQDALRVLAAQNRMSMAELARTIVVRALDSDVGWHIVGLALGCAAPGAAAPPGPPAGGQP